MTKIALNRTSIAVMAILSAFAVLVGCGGGGGGGSLGGLNIFISDDLSTGFDQVWVTVHEVELQGAGGAHTTVFSSSEGVVVDLTNLNDGAARFLFLGSDSIGAGDFTGARITLGRDVTLVPTGGTSGVACLFAVQFDFGTDKSRFSFNFGGTETFASNDDFVIDFDLSQWEKNGNFITPVALKGDDSTLGDDSRHEEDDYSGTISGLSGTAPNQTFTLTKDGNRVNVFTDTDTIIFNEDSSSSPTLANGQRVEVSGMFDRLERRIEADQIKIEDDDLNDEDDFEVEGVTRNFVEGSLTFDVLIREAEGFFPSEAIVHVQISQSTRFTTKSGIPMTLDEMVALLNGGPLEVEVEGHYDAPSNTINATKMKLHPEDDDEHEAEARGTASNINPSLGTFSLSIDEWAGFSSSRGHTINVTTDGSTTYEGPDGEDWTATQFFAQVANGSVVKVHGTFLEGTIAADRVRLRDGGGGGGEGHDEAKGYVVSFDANAGEVVISVLEWFGFEFSFGDPLTIHTTGSTRYRPKNGDDITKEQFFNELSVGRVIDTEGGFDSGVIAAKRLRFKD